MRGFVGVVLVGACAGMTAHYLPTHHSDATLWHAARRQSETLPRPLLNLGATALRRGAPSEAEEWWQKAEATGRMTPLEQQALCEMRRFALVRYGRWTARWPTCRLEPVSSSD